MPSERKPKLGALAVRKGFASENEVETALDLQKNLEPSADRPAAKVGEILVEMGALTGDMLQVLLEEQVEAAGRAPEEPEAPSTPDARLIVRSAVPLSVNGKPVTATTALKKGDILKIGNAVIQVDASLTIVPASDAPPEAVAPPKPAGMFGKVADLGSRFFKKKEPSGTEMPAPAGPGFGEKLRNAAARTGATVKRMLKDAAKKKWAKDRLGSGRRRDELLIDVARAAIRIGKVEGPELEAAKAALRTLDQAEHTTSLRGSATSPDEASRHRTSIKAARDNVELALAKLGYLVLQKGPEPPGMAAKLAEIREIDEALAAPE